ncbi:MAG: YfiR family protein [Sediminibacterium sp.]|nr:YfiR family protein [Sediminibacterium sp.]
MLLLCLFIIQSLHAQSTASKEYRVKAVFLFNFTQFVEWPSAAFSNPTAPFVIGILGDDPFGSSIDETIQNEKVGGHPLIVQRYHDLRDLKSCHILFINGSDPEKVRENLLVVNRYTLTVSDADNFMRAGGIIRLITENNKIRLQVNPEAARGAELFISSKLLRVSEIFDPKSQPR